MTSSEIKDLLRDEPDMDRRAIARALSVKGDDRRILRQTLKRMIEDGEIVKSPKRKTYSLQGELPKVTVYTAERVDEHGDLWGRPEVWRGDGQAPSVLIREDQPGKSKGRGRSGAVGVGDRVLARLKPGSQDSESPMRVVAMKKLSARATENLGVLIHTGRGWRIQPASKKARDDYTVKDVPGTVSEKSKTLVRFRSSGERGRSDRRATISEIIGPADDPKSASAISLEERGIPVPFPEGVVEEAQSLTLPKLEGAREDLRHLPLITIDPADAKDFDDAVLAHPDATKDNPGGWVCWVAIADVAAFVTPGSKLDKAAEQRGNSVYLPDRVVPMLPHELSSDLCSLRPHEDRACMAVRMRFARDGRKIGHKFKRGIMRSHARLTYGEAQAGFDGHPGETAQTVHDQLEDLYGAYQTLLEGRKRRAPLAIELPERRVNLDADGNVESITVRERFDAHKLIEEFMVQANVCASETLAKRNAPALERVHEPPAYEKLQGLSQFLPNLDLKWSMGERASTARFNKLLAEAEVRDLTEVVSMSVLRSQSTAFYGTESDGHFGLNLDNYAHFTSPIRRYADLVVHRALIKALGLGDDGMTKRQTVRLKEIGEHISDMERRAMAAERDATDRYVAAYLEDQTGAIFNARINGVTKFGLFITLDETGADGLIPVRTLGSEYYVYDESKQALIGQDSGGTYRLGMRVKAKLVEANTITGGMTFEIITKPERGKRPKGRSKDTGQSRRGKSKRKRR